MMSNPPSDFWPSADGVTSLPSPDDVVLNDEMLSSAGGPSSAVLQAEPAMETDMAWAPFTDDELRCILQGYSDTAESETDHYVGSVPGAAADLHTLPPTHVPDEQHGYTATQGGLEQETKQSALAVLAVNSSTNRWPEMQRGQPDRNKMAGVFNFSIDAGSNAHYSRKLSTLFVNINTNFTIHFKWAVALLGDNPMYVRAIVMYGDEAHKQSRVTICAKHCDFREGVTAEERRAECSNVLQSASATGSRGLHYCGAPHPPDMWYSVLTPLEPAHAYRMRCRGSCEPDTQRRLKLILFVLEDPQGTKFGVDLLQVQVCAVPSRDMGNAEKAENSAPSARRKRRASASASASAPASATSDRERAREPATLTLPPIPVATPEIMYQALHHIKVVTKSSIRSNDLTPEGLDAHKNTIKEVKKIMNDLKRQM